MMSSENGEGNMIDEKLLSLAERFVVALEGIHETYRRHNQPAERREVRPAVVTRVPNREDRIRETQGASTQPLSQWLSEVEEEEQEKEFMGQYERRWADANPGRVSNE